ADRGLCQELVYGVVRWQRTLDWLIARKTGSRTQKETLQILLRLGLYQIFWLDRVPDHAAVNETVELAKRLGCGPQAGFADASRLLAQWCAEGVEYDSFHRDWLEKNLSFELKSHPPLATLPSFLQGLFYVQDPGTLLAVRALDPRPGETILDLCAAPGGKTTYIAQLMQNRGRLVAEDQNRVRLQLLREN